MVDFILYGPIILIVGFVLAIIGISHMLRNRRSPGSTVAWLLLFIMLPYLGAVLYLMFGGRKLRQDRARISTRFFDLRYRVPRTAANSLDLMLRNYGLPPATTHNHVHLCHDGQEAYQQLLRLFDKATESIDLVTYIFGYDATGIDVRDRLVQRARDGIHVRVLVDGLGSMKTSRAFFAPLEQAGGQFAVFKPVVDFPFRSRTNLRNHRKIAVVDGMRSFAGGMNITQDELHASTSPEAWQDISLMVEGPAANHLQSVFRADWEYATGYATHRTASPCPNYETLDRPLSDRRSIVQIVPSGPDIPQDPMYSASLTAIFRAKRRIWIATPYFVPDDALANAVCIACRRGIDVRLLVPRRSNHPLSDIAGAPIIRDISDAGGTILLYEQGMMHAKMMLVDNEFATVGSANLDMRSLFLNYEIMQMCYSQSDIDAVTQWFLGLAEQCHAKVPKPGYLGELAEGAIRIVSPLF